MKFTCVKHKGLIIPAFESDHKAFKSVKEGSFLSAEVNNRKRQVKHHNLFFKRLMMIYDNCEHNYPSVDRLRDDFTIRAGYYDMYICVDGSSRIDAQSISFKSMGEDKFSEYEKQFLKQINKYFDADTLQAIEKELEDYNNKLINNKQ